MDLYTGELQEMQVRLLQTCDARRRAAQVRSGEARTAAYYMHRADDGAVVALGNRAIADAQRAVDEADGGLVAKICGYSHR